MFNFLKKLPSCFPKCLCHFTFPSVVYEGPRCSTSLSTLVPACLLKHFYLFLFFYFKLVQLSVFFRLCFKSNYVFISFHSEGNADCRFPTLYILISGHSNTHESSVPLKYIHKKLFLIPCPTPKQILNSEPSKFWLWSLSLLLWALEMMKTPWKFPSLKVLLDIGARARLFSSLIIWGVWRGSSFSTLLCDLYPRFGTAPPGNSGLFQQDLEGLCPCRDPGRPACLLTWAHPACSQLLAPAGHALPVLGHSVLENTGFLQCGLALFVLCCSSSTDCVPADRKN